MEPDFMMGYWGEAMAHNHPLRGDPQETEAARAYAQFSRQWRQANADLPEIHEAREYLQRAGMESEER
jgi:hypothetical protein